MEKTSEHSRIFFLTAGTALLLVLFTILGMTQLKNSYTDQIVTLLGALSETIEIPKESLDMLLSGEVSDETYVQGMQLLKDTGYGQSGILLIRTQLGGVIFFFCAGTALIFGMLLAGMFYLERKRNIFLKNTVRWVRHLDDLSLEKKAKESAVQENRELIYALQEHKRLDNRQKDCLAIEKKKTLSFVEDISHQLKTPLTIMRMHIEKMNYAQEFQPVSLQKAISQVDKMVLLISMMMKVGMLNSGKSKMVIQPHKIWVLAEEIVQEFEPYCEQKQVTLHSEVKGHSGFYYDDYWFKEALENLVKNCIEYSNPDGVVSILYKVGSSGLSVQVRDQGKGIEEQNVEHIFDRFTSSFRQNDSSSGLGLAVAKQVVEAHFGKISVKNNKDKGVTFFVYLPLLRGKNVYQDANEKEVAQENEDSAAE